MTHTVRDWMSSPVVVVDPDTVVSYALTLMRRRGIRSLVVYIPNPKPEYGIVTTTDIRDKVIASERKPSELCVRDIMTAPVITAMTTWSLKQCSTTMQERRINHLPVCDENNNLVGMISTTDLFIAAEEIGWEDMA